MPKFNVCRIIGCARTKHCIFAWDVFPVIIMMMIDQHTTRPVSPCYSYALQDGLAPQWFRRQAVQVHGLPSLCVPLLLYVCHSGSIQPQCICSARVKSHVCPCDTHARERLSCSVACMRSLADTNTQFQSPRRLHEG